MTNTRMWQECQALQDWIVDIRRTLHKIPEVGTDLPETQSAICKILDELGIAYQKNKGDSGIVGTIKAKAGNACKSNNKTVLLRADIDALPVTEETGLACAPSPDSKHAHCMHACGHDAHAAMLLGALRVLHENRDDLSVNVKFIFQTGEEYGLGAKIAAKEGVMDNVDAAFGMHIGCLLDPKIPSGHMIIMPGPCMASCDKFVLTVKGRGCHGSTPERGVDPISIASHIVLSLQEIITREVSGLQPAVLTIGKIAGGFSYNIIPDEVIIEGTTRTFSEQVRHYLARRIEEIAKSVAATFRAECACEIFWNASPVVNDPDMAALASAAAAKVIGPEKVVTSHEPSMVSEDFSVYLESAPGAFMFLSTSDHEKHTDVPHHNPKFDIDESVLYEGSAVFVSVVQEYQERECGLAR